MDSPTPVSRAEKFKTDKTFLLYLFIYIFSFYFTYYFIFYSRTPVSRAEEFKPHKTFLLYLFSYIFYFICYYVFRSNFAISKGKTESASIIAPDPVFRQQELTRSETTKELAKTTDNVLIHPTPQSSQESNPQVEEQFPSPQHVSNIVTSGGPVVDETSPSNSSRDSKQEQVTKDIENLSVKVKRYQDECEDLHQQLKRVKQYKLQLKYELDNQRRMKEDQDRSHVTEMEQNVQSLTVTNEQVVDKLKTSKDNLAMKLEESNTQCQTLQTSNDELKIQLEESNTRCSDVDELMLKYLELRKDGEERNYIASLYYQQLDPRTLEIHFVITWDLEAHITAAKKYLEGLGAKEHMNVKFKKPEISLNVPMTGVIIEEKWNLKPSVPPRIHQSIVDSFKPGRKIVSRRLKATLTRDLGVEVPACSHLVTLDGADESMNQMQIEIDTYVPSKERGQVTSLFTVPSVSHGSSSQAGEDNQGDTNQLCIDHDLHKVYSQLFPAAKDWLNMGLALGIKVDILEGIKSKENSDTDRLREMLTHWFRSSPSCTWRDICNCLRSITVKQNNLAGTIEELYQGTLRSSSSM